MVLGELVRRRRESSSAVHIDSAVLPIGVVSMSDTKWTPGPWEFSSNGMTMDDTHVNSFGRPNWAHVRGTANARLIALAPEMAEAILEWSFASADDIDARDRAEDSLDDLADKLRAIGDTPSTNEYPICIECGEPIHNCLIAVGAATRHAECHSKMVKELVDVLLVDYDAGRDVRL